MTVTVVTRAEKTALTTVDHVRGDLGLGAETPPNAQIERWIAQASSSAATFCRRTFGRETVRERFEIGHGSIDDTTGGLLLECGPVEEVVSVTVDGEALAAGSFEVESRQLYRLQDGARRCWYGRVILVEYVAGWWLPSDTGTKPAGAIDLPDDIERAAIQLVAASISAASRDPMVKSESEDGVGSTSWYVQGASAALPHPEAEATLAQYRRVMLG